MPLCMSGCQLVSGVTCPWKVRSRAGRSTLHRMQASPNGVDVWSSTSFALRASLLLPSSLAAACLRTQSPSPPCLAVPAARPLSTSRVPSGFLASPADGCI